MSIVKGVGLGLPGGARWSYLLHLLLFLLLSQEHSQRNYIYPSHHQDGYDTKTCYREGGREGSALYCQHNYFIKTRRKSHKKQQHSD